MAQCAAEDASDATLIAARDVQPRHLLDHAGYLFVCPENLGSMSGAMKEMFDRCYYPLLERIEGRPYATLIAAGSSGEGAQAQLDRIVTGWRLRRVADPVILDFAAQTPERILAQKKLSAQQEDKCRAIGEALATGLEMGVF